MKKIIALFLLVHLSSSASVILYTDVPQSLKNLLQEAQAEVEYQVKAQCPSEYLFQASTYEPHISLSYISKTKTSLKNLYAAEPSLKAKLIALANRIAPINMDSSIQNLKIELWPSPNPRPYLGNTYNNVIILVITLPVPKELYSFTQEIDKELDSLSTINKRTFAFKAHATIGWLHHKDDQDPTAFAKKLKERLQKYIDRFNQRNEQYMIDSFFLAAGNQKKKFILQKFRTSNASQSDHLRPAARPSRPGCSYCPTSYTRAQNGYPRSR